MNKKKLILALDILVLVLTIADIILTIKKK